jgi:prepilin peptidase CpaA
MASEQVTVLVATCLVLILSVFTDIRDGKIYNAVTLPFALLGLILNVIHKGLPGVLFSLAGLGVGLALFFVSALVGRILGAGDCKLFAAVGALQGPQFILWAVLCSLIVGGVFGILVALWRGVLRHSLRRVWEAVYFKLYLKVPMDISQSSSQLRLPYAVAILAGSLFTLWWQQGRVP